ncbi:hypothetical protein NUACC21_81600 [Scytonema sp. NUACC21]
MLAAIDIVSIIILFKQLMPYKKAKSKFSHNQTPQVSHETQQCLHEMEFLMVRQTNRLEYAINLLQIQLSNQLQAKESFLCFCKAVEDLSEAICVTDADGFVTDINKAFLPLFRYSIDELNATGGLFSWVGATEAGEEICNLILNGYTWLGQVEMCVDNDELIEVELHALPVENSVAQIIGVVFIFIDLNENKPVEIAEKQSEKRFNIA